MISQIEWSQGDADTPSVGSSDMLRAASVGIEGAGKVTSLSAVCALGGTVLLAGDSNGMLHIAVPSADTQSPHTVLTSVKVQHGAITLIATSAAIPSAAPGSDFVIALTGPNTPHVTCASFAALCRSAVAPIGQKKRGRAAKRGEAEPTGVPASLVFLKGHTLQVTDIVFRRMRAGLVCFTSSIDATVRGFCPFTGVSKFNIAMPHQTPALALAFDNTGLQPDAFVVGGIGECILVDLVPASRPGFATTDRPSKPEGQADAIMCQVPVARALEMPPRAESDDVDATVPWYLKVEWNVAENELSVTRAMVPKAGLPTEALVTNRIVRCPAVAPMVVGEITATASASFDDLRAKCSRAQCATRPFESPLPAAIAGAFGVVWPAAHVAEPTTRAAQVLVEEGEAPDMDSDDEFAEDDDVLQLRKEREELRRMCAELMQKRKALRTEMRVTA